MMRLIAGWILLTLALPGLSAPENGKVFQDWVVNCESLEQPENEEAAQEEKADEAERCYIVQIISLKETNQRLVHMAVGHLTAEQTPAAIITLPLGVSLPPGLGLQIDDGEAQRFAVERCHVGGCVGALALNNEAIEAMKKGENALVIFYDTNRREVGVNISLKGFTAGFDSLK